MPDKEKERLRQQMKGNKFASRKHTPEEKLRQSLFRKGRKGPNLGRKWSEETRKKMSLGHIGNKSNTGKFSITNGVVNKFLILGTSVPEGWNKGSTRNKSIK